MKILKIILALLVLGTVSLEAQNAATFAAFEESYALEAKGEYTKAISTIQKEYSEKSYEANLRLAWLHYNAGLFSESCNYYNKCISLMPMALEPKLGYVYPAAALGEWNKVLTQYLAILKIDPNHSVVNYKIGLIYYGKKEYKTAYKYFEKVVNLYPFDYSGMLYLGWTNYFMGNTQKAKALFNKVLLYAPNDTSALEGLGLIQ
jgi:tetratricopeptide (TPR) repeat protein